MNGLNHLRLFRLRTVFDGSPAAALSSPERCAEPDQLGLARECLLQLEREPGITTDERAQWTTFSRNVLVQIERISAARQAARNRAVSDPARADLKRELIRQIIVTPGLLSQAAKNLYAALTPEQQRLSGERLLKFHRRLVG